MATFPDNQPLLSEVVLALRNFEASYFEGTTDIEEVNSLDRTYQVIYIQVIKCRRKALPFEGENKLVNSAVRVKG
jgi:hypothetical protein